MNRSIAELKQRASQTIAALRDELTEVSRTIHAHPELAFHEYQASALLAGKLAEHGFAVERNVAGLETAFRAEAHGACAGPTVALIAEYDALPEIGHACGHNLIAASAIGAGIAVRSVIDHLPGRVVVIGTPAEEGGGGKIILLERGIFHDIDAALLVHPSCWNVVDSHSLASTRLKVEFVGKASHASASPEDGINALEAVILTFNNVNALRLHLKSDARVHGIITHGGTVANIIPEYAAAVFSVRAHTKQAAEQILERVIHCAEAAGMATGAHLNSTVKPGYAELLSNRAMAQRFAENWETLGIQVRPHSWNEGMASTDMGNVSQFVPSIHPTVAIAPDGTPAHTSAFREAAISPAGHAGMISAAKVLAMTTIDLLSDADLMRQIKQEFEASRR